MERPQICSHYGRAGSAGHYITLHTLAPSERQRWNQIAHHMDKRAHTWDVYDRKLLWAQLRTLVTAARQQRSDRDNCRKQAIEIAEFIVQRFLDIYKDTNCGVHVLILAGCQCTNYMSSLAATYLNTRKCLCDFLTIDLLHSFVVIQFEYICR